MRNIFFIYMPPGNHQAMVNYEATIKSGVPLDRLRPFLSPAELDRVADLFRGRPLTVWGSADTPRNRTFFDGMRPGDDLVIIEGTSVRFVGKIAIKRIDPKLSRELWKPLRSGEADATSWDLVYLIANPKEIEVPREELFSVIGYKPGHQPRGLSALESEKLKTFYSRYDSVYSVLLRLQAGQQVQPVESPVNLEADAAGAVLPDPEPQVVPGSEHSRIQWILARLGATAGEKVWVPPSDQARIRSLYQFDKFEPAFTTGIDLPPKYVQNIDVVWKEEFRINAAFEVENTTSIYSGLLRFADLNVVAPNTTYPMFIVAPAERRERVRDQVHRPLFKRLDLPNKVRFLSYDAVDEIDRFFPGETPGLTVSVIHGKAESLV